MTTQSTASHIEVLMFCPREVTSEKHKFYVQGIYVHNHLERMMEYDIPYGFSEKPKEDGKYQVNVKKDVESDPIPAIMYAWKSSRNRDGFLDRGIIVIESDDLGVKYAEKLLKDKPDYI